MVSSGYVTEDRSTQIADGLVFPPLDRNRDRLEPEVSFDVDQRCGVIHRRRVLPQDLTYRCSGQTASDRCADHVGPGCKKDEDANRPGVEAADPIQNDQLVGAVGDN